MLVREHVVRCGESRNLVGILTKPESAPTEATAVLLINAGLIHRIGPNRSYVHLARRLAREGLTVCRFDISGIGDSSPGDVGGSVVDIGVGDTRVVMDYIEKSIGIRHYVLGGICSGADIALQVARVDQRVAGTILINGSLLPEDVAQRLYVPAQQRTMSRYYRKNLLDPGSWRRLLAGKSRLLGNLPKLLISVTGRSGAARGETEDSVRLSDWRVLVQRGVAVLLVYSEGSTALDFYALHLERHLGHSIKAGRIDLWLAKNTDHVFTPLAAQQELIDRIARWLRHHGDTRPQSSPSAGSADTT